MTLVPRAYDYLSTQSPVYMHDGMFSFMLKQPSRGTALVQHIFLQVQLHK